MEKYQFLRMRKAYMLCGMKSIDSWDFINTSEISAV